MVFNDAEKEYDRHPAFRSQSALYEFQNWFPNNLKIESSGV